MNSDDEHWSWSDEEKDDEKTEEQPYKSRITYNDVRNNIYSEKHFEKMLYKDLKEQYDFVDSLPDQDRALITGYTYMSYREINQKLRDNEFLDEEELKTLEVINKALKDVPKIKKPLTVYRGVMVERDNFDISKGMRVRSTNPFGVKKGESLKKGENEGVNESLNESLSKDDAPKSIISATLDKETALQGNFTKFYKYKTTEKRRCCFLEIRLPVGSSILPLYTIAVYGGEANEFEVLLDRRGEYFMTGENEVYQTDEDRKNNVLTYVYYITHIPGNSVLV
jgi:hypothetical protein